MRLSRFAFIGAILASSAAATVAMSVSFDRAVDAIDSISHWFERATTSIRDFTFALIDWAFPAQAPFELVALATAPAVLGRAETRSFHQRRVERTSSGRHRAPLSSAFAAAA